MDKKGQMHGGAIGGIWTLVYIVILVAIGGLVTAVLVRFMGQQAVLMVENSSEYNITLQAQEVAGITFGQIVTVIGIAVIVIIVGLLLGLLGVFGGKRE